MRAGEIGKYKCKISSGCNKDCLIELQILKQPSRTPKKCNAQDCLQPCLYHPNYYDWTGKLPDNLFVPKSEDLEFVSSL